MSVGIYIFCRDLRITDNKSLHDFAKEVDKVVPIFILDPAQVYTTRRNRYYFSHNALQFMCESLKDLHRQCKGKLLLFLGSPSEVVSLLLETYSEIISVGTARDFSAYAQRRELALKKVCSAAKVHFSLYADDFSLIPIKELCKKDGSAYKKFFSFYQSVKRSKITVLPVWKPALVQLSGLGALRKKGILKSIRFLSTLYQQNSLLAQRGGRSEGLKRLKDVTRNKKYYKKYSTLHSKLDYKTLCISGYLNFGCLSVRETFSFLSKAFGRGSEILKQLWWRDFFLQAAIFIEGGERFDYLDPRFRNIAWKNPAALWKKLVAAKTGFLIVDAGMEEMMQTGYMHNRARMIVGHFWTKYCLIDTFHPKYGSQVGYSKYLLDAVGISQNKMNQHWITEFDYSGRKFAPKNNPLAGRPMDVSNGAIKKFDPECKYIKRWLPCLADIDCRVLWGWNKETWKEVQCHVPPIFSNPKKKYTEWLEACRKAL